MATGWFLEKNAKFYGPFQAEKVLSYATTGKISRDTRVARDAVGKDAKPFFQIEALLRAPQGEVTEDTDLVEDVLSPTVPFEGMTATPMNPTTDAKAGPEGISKAWYVVTEERRFGPYSLGHLESLVQQGKLKAQDLIQREGQSHLVPVSELFPDGPSKPMIKSKPVPKEPAKKVGPSPPSQAASKKSAAPRGRRQSVILSLGLGMVIAVGLALFWPKNGLDNPPENKTLSSLKSGIQQVSSLRRQVHESVPLPPFKELVENALQDLNFDWQALQQSCVDDLLIYSNEGPKEYASYFPDRIRREIRYAKNGGYYYTYLVGNDGSIFAVVVSSDSFKRIQREASNIVGFSKAAHELREFHGITWSVEIASGVFAKACWQSDSGGTETLKALIVMNDPKFI